MKCLLCGQTMKAVLTFSSILLLRNDDSYLCSDCDSTFERIGEEYCPNCMKIDLSTKCQDCQFWCKEGVEVSHRAIFTYNQAMKDFFSRYKFDGDFLLRKVFASFLSEELKEYKEYQFVVIPLSPDRYADRGFNQVEGLVDAAGFAYLDLLEKIEERASSSKSRSERLETEFPFLLKVESLFLKKSYL